MLKLPGTVNLPHHLLTVLVILSALKGTAQICTGSQKSNGSTQVRQLYPDCDNIVTAPDGQTSALIDKSGKITVRVAGRSLSTSASTDLPVLFSWSPRSTAFFLNDGEGSGMSSRFRFFHLGDAGPEESSGLEDRIVRSYRQRHHCSARQIDPNVYGIGWSTDGKRVYLIAQSTVNDPCGRPDRFIGYIATTGSRKLVSILSTRQARTAFRLLLPKELLTD